MDYENDSRRWTKRHISSRFFNGNTRINSNTSHYYDKYVNVFHNQIFLTILRLIFVIVVVGSVSPSMYYLTHIMKKEFIDGEFETVTEEPISFEEIKSGADFWAVSRSI